MSSPLIRVDDEFKKYLREMRKRMRISSDKHATWVIAKMLKENKGDVKF